LAAIAIPNFVRARAKAQINTCIANLKQVDGAKESWALETKKTTGSACDMSDLVTAYIKSTPMCPAGNASYNVNAIGVDPTCPQQILQPADPDLKYHKLGATQ
jgi:hypothetical protein